LTQETEAQAVTKDELRLPTQEDVAGSAWPGDGLRVSSLTRSFGGRRAVDDVSFAVPSGGVCTILGASGSGKTTTLRMIAGLERPDAGSIWIDGRKVAGDGILVAPEHRNIGLVFQSYALWPHMSVQQQIAYPLRVRGVHREEIREAVAEAARMVGLLEFLERYPWQLSGGQQQRVALARAIVFGPRLLLLDEPLSGLDAALRRQTRGELERLQRRLGVTTVYVTHDQEEAMAVSDTVIVMHDGKAVSIATPRQLYSHPDSAYVASFVGASNLIDGVIATADGHRVTLRLTDGKLVEGQSSDPDLQRVSTQAMLAIKPVDVRVLPVSADAEVGTVNNVLAGQVVAATYLGPHLELTVVASGTEIRVPVGRDSSLGPGDKVRLELPRQCVTILHGGIASD
jgi:iron(III) transport system ATP-binding protein